MTLIQAIGWIDNSPKAPPIQIGDCVLFEHGYPVRRTSGYVTEKRDGWIRTYYGPIMNESQVLKILPRHGRPIPHGNAALPLDHF